MRSIFPKIRNFTNDFLERSVDIAMCSETWEDVDKEVHHNEIEYMLEMNGLLYLSTPRTHKKGGGVAIIINKRTFKASKLLDIKVPSNLEVLWVLAKPVSKRANLKRIILCSFYSPPGSNLKMQLVDHILGVL